MALTRGQMWDAYQERCAKIMADPKIQEAHKQWLNGQGGDDASPVSPIVNAKLAAYSELCLGGKVARIFSEKLSAGAATRAR